MEQDLTAKLKQFFGFDTFKGNQEAIIRNILDGKDTFVLMPTGGGKSLCYQLPALIGDGVAIVISPLIALMKNQVDALRGYSTNDNIAHFLNSSLNKQAIQEVKNDVISGQTKLLYVAPESLTKEENVDFLRKVKVSFYAVDEAHCISEWGHDFRPEYRRIRPIIDEIGKAPVIALTATATPKVQQDIQKSLGMTNATVFKSSFNRPNLYYEVRPKVDATKEIVHILQSNPGKSAIVYCLSRKKVEEMAQTLIVNGIKAAPYHAGLDAATRAANQDKFLMEEVDVVCATIAFGMGIDKPDVRFVIHYDIPKSLEGYYQETGRAGRDGGEGRCIAFYSYKDIKKLENFMEGKPIAEQEIGRQLINETLAYVESGDCRRRTLLKYFGEDYTDPNCGACDNCKMPKERFNAQDAMLKLISVVSELGGRFKTEHIVSFITGEATHDIKTYRHDKHELFGCGKNKDARFWTSVVRQAIVGGYLIKEIESYGLLKLTDKALEYEKHPQQLMFTLDRDYSNATDDEAAASGAALDEELFGMLKSLRKDVGAKMHVPPYAVFSDAALEAMSTYYPIDIAELQKNIPGVGEGKAKKFGQPFVELIARHVEQNEIERPISSVMKNLVSDKTQDKVEIIRAVDDKRDLAELADNKNMEFGELLKKLESIVYSGTKLNIKYYIDEELDEDEFDDIYEYFKEAETDDIKTAMQEFSDEDYPEEHIRLVRIYFISMVGN
ncbi:MAG: DNA helicase RecQ [Marinilabiliaceae bacterium]|nr:DNA helicase RecQ [Marinilabiliaceae bacterium]